MWARFSCRFFFFSQLFFLLCFHHFLILCNDSIRISCSFPFFSIFSFKNPHAMPKNVWYLRTNPTYSFRFGILCVDGEACASKMPWKIWKCWDKVSHTHPKRSTARFTYSFSLITSNPFLLCRFCTVEDVLRTSKRLGTCVHVRTKWRIFFCPHTEGFLLILVIVRFYIPF